MPDKPQIARKLAFRSLADLIADANRIADHPAAVSHGQWTPAQNIWHVARVIQASVEGFPVGPPLLLKLIGPLMKNRVTRKPFNPGIKLPANFAEHFVAKPDTTMDRAIGLLETWVAEREQRGFIPASPLFGKLSAEQWEMLHCRHAEMHFGLIALPD